MKTCWAEFDRLTSAAAQKTVDFGEYLRAVTPFLTILARRARKHRRVPAWLTEDDLISEAQALCWYYLFTYVSTRGHVGFDPTRFYSGYSFAGKFLRWAVGKRLVKTISKASGQNQHRRVGPSRTTEQLTATGDLPEFVQAQSPEEALDTKREIQRQGTAMARVAETTREFVVARALEQCSGASAEITAYLVANDEPDVAEVVGVLTRRARKQVARKRHQEKSA